MKKRIIDLVVVLCLISFTFGCNKDDNNDINGKQWYDLGSIDVNRFAVTLCSDPDGNIYAAGFSDANDIYYVAKWNGKTWSKVGGLTSNSCIYYLSSDLEGNIYASGNLVDNTDTYYYLAKWDGTTWTDLGLHDDYGGNMLISVTDKSGKLFATSTNGPGDDVYAYIGGTSWSNLGSLNPDHSITSICSDGNGKVYEMIYSYSFYPPVIAVYQNGVWSELPALTTDANNYIRSSCTDANGNLYVAGDLYDNTAKKYYVGKWNGSSWTKLSGLNGDVQCICVDPQGNLYAAGSMSFGTSGFDVAKWDGSKWVALGSLNSKINNHAICSDHNGAIYVEGTFNSNYDKLIKVYK